MKKLVAIEKVHKLYDLSSGYLGDDDIGMYDGQIRVYSAEAFLNDIEHFLTQEDRPGFKLLIRRVSVQDEKIWYRAGMI